MSTEDETYCRLCADPTPKFQLISPQEDVAISSKVATKLLWINIDIESSSTLPNTICFACFDSLERTWAFLHNVRIAQKKLSNIFSVKVDVENAESVTKFESSNAGKPVNTDWETFQNLKIEVKVESETVSGTNEVNETTEVTGETLLKEIKSENYNEDYQDTIDSEFHNGYNSSDSDLPLGVTLRQKSLKCKRKAKHKVNKQSDSIDISSISTTWENLMCSCGRCDAQCKNITALQLHSLQIHNQCCVFKCLYCSKKFLTFKPFITHTRSHVTDLRYCCEFCNNLFTRSSYLKRHRNKEHGTIYQTKCRNCGTCFETEEQLEDHKISYSTDHKRGVYKECILKCEFCDKKFKSKSNLQQHKLVHTERSRDFSCHVCGKMFFTKGTLGTHMMTHEETKPFKCEFCPLAFRARGNLQSHLSLHSGAKPFVCEQCGKSFRVKRHLKSHSIVHTDLMPFPCQYCNKAFRFKTRLNLHLRQHTGAKPYRCVLCQRDFTNGSNFKKHMKRRHGIDTSRQKYGNVGDGVKPTCNVLVGTDNEVLSQIHT